VILYGDVLLLLFKNSITHLGRISNLSEGFEDIPVIYCMI